jgi:hypothetical protein
MGWTRYFRRARRDADFAREISSYIDIETDENIGRGMTAEAGISSFRYSSPSCLTNN